MPFCGGNRALSFLSKTILRRPGSAFLAVTPLAQKSRRTRPAAAIRGLIETQPPFALCLIEGLVAKGKCYSALAQMLGTRSVVERLAQLLMILAENHGRRDGNRLVIERKITHDQIATIVGSTRQWVTMTLDKFQKKGIISVARQSIVIERYDLLMAQVGAE